MINETLSLGECPIIKPEGIYYGGRRVIALDPSLGVGALERTNPIPAGRYWVDVFTPQEAAFQDWLRRNKANVIVTTTQTFAPDDMGGYPGRVWRLFETRAPVIWEGPGFPSIATPDIKSADDTVQQPAKEKDPLDKIPNPLDGGATFVKGVADAAKIVLIVGAVVVGGVLVVRYLPRPAPSPPQPRPPEPSRA